MWLPRIKFPRITTGPFGLATFKAIVFQTGGHIKQNGTSNIKIRIGWSMWGVVGFRIEEKEEKEEKTEAPSIVWFPIFGGIK